MTKFHTVFKTLLVACFTLVVVSVVQAQASRTWVAGLGDDANPCSRTAPCKTLGHAVAVTAVNGQVNILDPGSYGPISITKSITIDGHDALSGSTHTGSGVLINYDLFAGTDTRKSVRLRNLNFQGINTGTRGIRIFS